MNRTHRGSPPRPVWVAQALLDTPLGPLRAVATHQGLAGLWFGTDKHHRGPIDAPEHLAHPFIEQARQWLADYWAGHDPAPGLVSLDLQGTPFQQAVWQALLAIPAGQTCSYGELAARVTAATGRRAVPRATGSAVGRNPVAVLVPCHRVLGADGSLTGYASGLALKEQLLRHEGALPPPLWQAALHAAQATTAA